MIDTALSVSIAFAAGSLIFLAFLLVLFWILDR